MPKSFVIWGCAGHAKVLVSLIKSEGGEILAFFDNKKVLSIMSEVMVYIGEPGFNAWVNVSKDLLNVNGLVAIGGPRGSDRMSIQNIFRAAGLRLDPLIHSKAFVCRTAELGEGTQVLAQAVVAADSRVGEVCIINHGACVDHECILGNGVHLAPAATVCGCVTIGDNVMVGAGAVVLPGLTIGHDVIIGAGSIVTKDIPPGTIVAGNPARLRQ